jgi:hypothetical protein
MPAMPCIDSRQPKGANYAGEPGSVSVVSDAIRTFPHDGAELPREQTRPFDASEPTFLSRGSSSPERHSLTRVRASALAPSIGILLMSTGPSCRGEASHQLIVTTTFPLARPLAT